MVVYTNSPKVRLARRRTVQMILSQHDCKCATRVRSRNCSLQTLANDLNITDTLYEERLEIQEWDKTFPLIRDSKKCIKCMRCVQVCDKIAGLGIWALEGTGARSTINVSGARTIAEADCSLCGQCITHCPVGALKERDDTEEFLRAVADPKKVVVIQVAPAVRAAWGEGLGLDLSEAAVGKIFDSLKRIGADYVFDTAFHILPETLEDVEPDHLFHDVTGAGIIFGATGGVMEAALRTAYHSLMGENCPPDAFKVVRAESQKTGLTEATFSLKDTNLRIAVVNGLANTRKLIEEIDRGEKKYDFVEVMACPGGCVGGGGQPIHDGEELAFARGKNLYFLDKNAKVRHSHENPDIKTLYENYFGTPNSHKAHNVLHTDHFAWEMPKSPKRDRDGYIVRERCV